MSEQQNSDSHVKLYLKTQKQLIYAGQYLQATADVQVLQDTSFKQIKISFVGIEKVQWQETKEKQVLKHKYQIESYREQRVLSFYEKGLKMGQYQFPFNILLPSALPASMKLDDNNYIKYILTVFIPGKEKQSYKQSVFLSLHIRQPLRQIFDAETKGMVQTKGCGCFGSKKTTEFSISTDRNQIHYTDKFKVRVEIDNKKGDFVFDQISLWLTRRITRISKETEIPSIHSIDQDIGEFYRSQKVVNVGKKKKFEIELYLPTRIVQYTAIGQIISRCYFLCLIGEGLCLQSSSRMHKHMILNNQVPLPQQKDQVERPQKWEPRIEKRKFFIDFKPYLYKPARGIDFKNQKGEVASQTIYRQSSAKSLYRIQ